MARKPLNPVAEAAHKAHTERQAAREADNAEAQRQMDESRPTPTQAELDAAKLGTLDNDDKDDDGSAPKKDAEVQSRAVRSESAAPYQNRAAKSE